MGVGVFVTGLSQISSFFPYVDVLKEELNSASVYVLAQLTKDKRLRHIDTLTKSNIKIDKLDLPTFIECRNYTKILTNHDSYQILVTALLPSYLSILQPLSQQSKIML